MGRGLCYNTDAFLIRMGTCMKKKFFDLTMLRFLLVGAANTLVGAGIMFALYNLAGCSYYVSSAANYICGGVLSFVLNRSFTFRSQTRDRKGIILEALRFALTVGACWFLAYSCAKPLALRLLADEGERLRDNLAMGIGMVIYTGLNYLGQRFFAFRGREDKQ